MQPRCFWPLLLLPLTLAKGQSEIDYSTPGVPLRTAIAEIARKAGKKLKVGDDLATEPVVLRLEHVPLDEAVKRIATVMQGEWVTTKDGPMLTRTPAIVNRLRGERRDARMKLIREELQKIADARKQAPVLNEETAGRIARQYAGMLAAEKEGKGLTVSTSRDKLSSQTADASLLADLVLAIGPETLASLPVGIRIFAVNPTEMQAPIPGITEERLGLYIRERNALARALNEALDPKSHDGMLFSGIQQANRAIQTGPVRVLLEVSAQPGHHLFLSMQVFDGKGSKISTTTWSFGRLDFRAYQDERKKVMDNPARKPAVKAWPALTELAKRELQDGASAGAKPLSKEALDLLLHPDVHDPIQLGFGPTMLDIAKQEGLNLVATLPDSQMVIALRGTDKGLVQPEVYELGLTRWGQARIERKEGWLLIESADPLEATLGRIDRASLATFMQSSYERGYTTLEDWADIAVANPYPTCFDSVIGSRNVLRGQNAMYDYAPWHVYRFYGLLSDTQLDAVRQGQPLLYGSLSPEQQECVQKMIFEWDVVRPTPTGNPEQDYKNAMAAEESLQGQPTEALPNGIPRTLGITMKSSEEERFFLSSDFEYRGSVRRESDRPVDLNWVAMLIAQNQRADLYPPGTTEVVRALRYGAERTLSFQCHVSATTQSEVKMQEEQKPTGEPIAVSELSSRLPGEVWKRLDEAIRKQLDYMQKNAAEIRKTMPKPEKAPPPPPLTLMR